MVKKALEGLKGVTSAEVSFRDKLARVTYEKGVVTIEQMIEAVKNAGFGARPQ
ncbi:MAG: heavy-metal-associated domain-containing protein [Candidatus Methylomirabilis oxyfera]|nr:heavy-metal-associated domain-containing protein [Candidatus Methylomirabilis oxyfera]